MWADEDGGASRRRNGSVRSMSAAIGDVALKQRIRAVEEVGAACVTGIIGDGETGEEEGAWEPGRLGGCACRPWVRCLGSHHSLMKLVGMRVVTKVAIVTRKGGRGVCLLGFRSSRLAFEGY